MDVVRKARVAVAVVFFANGVAFASWSPRIPELRERLGLDEAGLGVALLGLAVGSLLAMPLAGALSARIGSRPVTRLAFVGSCVALPLPALAPTPVTFALALLVVGAFMGSLDVAMNAQGVAVERRAGRPILSGFHGTFSVGAGLGALLGGGALAAGVSPALQLALTGLVTGVVVVPWSAALLPAAEDRLGPRQAEGPRRAPLRPAPALLALGAIAFACLLAEGSMIDWSAVYLRSIGAEGAAVALGFAAFSVTMALGRFAGDRVVARIGARALLVWAAALGATGLAGGLWVGTPAAATVGFAVLGIGLSAVVPVVFSAADRAGGGAAGPSIAVVSTIGYCGFLAGPPLIGLVARAVGLPTALTGVAVLVALIPLLATLALPRKAAAPDEAAEPASVGRG